MSLLTNPSLVKLNSRSRIVIVGTSGSGKSTLARRLSREWGLQDIELDALFWGPDWSEAPPEIFRERLLAAMAASTGWVVHGNYRKTRDLSWGRAEIIIWLDYSLSLVMWRVLKRSVLRILSRESLWGTGNRESFGKTFLSKKSILLWAWQSYPRNRASYSELVTNPEPAFAHLRVLRFRKPRELELFWGGKY